MRGVSQMWRWMLAEGVIEDMKVVDEIIGSDSKAGISILKRNGSSRRTKQAYCQLKHVKIMKYGTEDMLSDSLTKVMTMPKHHVKKYGLKDLQLATIAMAMASQMVRAEASAAASETIDNHPGFEWFVLKAALILFMMGVLTGMYPMFKVKALTAKKELTMTTVRSQTTEKMVGTARQVFIAPVSRRHYHMIKGIAAAWQVQEKSER